MRLRLSLALLFVTSVQAFSQQPAANPPVSTPPKDPRAFFESSVRHYDFSDAKLEPWHLKATYQLYDFEGKPTVHGTWEYWWASPKIRRESWERPGMSRTDWISEDGTIYSKVTGESLHYFEGRLEDLLLHPGPNYELVEAGKYTLGLKTIGEGRGSSTCLTTLWQPKDDGKQKIPMQGIPDLFCFDPGSMALMASYSDHTLIQYSQFVQLQDHYFPRKISVQIDKQTVLSVSVESIDHIAVNDSSLIHPADAVPGRQSIQYRFDVSTPPGKVTPGKLIKKSYPYYPPLAKSQHIQGVVILGATIGTDGKVNDLEVLGAPSKLLADSAVDCVKRWEYEPFLLDGEPVEVETTINVIYTLGG